MTWIEAIPYVCAGLGGLSLLAGLGYKRLLPSRWEAPTPPADAPAEGFSRRLETLRRKRARQIDDELRERALQELQDEEEARAEREVFEQAAASAAEYEADAARLKNFDVFRSLLTEAQALGSEAATVDLQPGALPTGTGPLSELFAELSTAQPQDWTRALDTLKELLVLTEELCALLELGRSEVVWRPEVRKAWEPRLAELAALEEDLFKSQRQESPPEETT